MTNGNFSATIVVDRIERAGQVDGVIPMNYGEEYCIRLRTNNGRKGVGRIWIDGVDVTGGGLIIPSHTFVNLDTPILSPGKRFKFVDVNSEEAERAGKQGEDVDGTKGLVKIEFRSEKPVAITTFRGDRPYKQVMFPYPNLRYPDVGAESCGSFPTQDVLKENLSTRTLGTGVTIEGSDSDQTFEPSYIDLEPVTTTILLKLKGIPRDVISYVPRYTSSCNYCSHCGQVANTLSNICYCGNKLR